MSPTPGWRVQRELRQLQSLSLADTQVTDAGLEHLKGLKELRSLDLTTTHVTDQGVKRLQQALPNCKIFRGSPAGP